MRAEKIKHIPCGSSLDMSALANIREIPATIAATMREDADALSAIIIRTVASARCPKCGPVKLEDCLFETPTGPACYVDGHLVHQ